MNPTDKIAACTATAATATITDRQIRTLREEALAAGDYAQADLCQRALAGDDTVDQNGNAIPYAEWTADEARAECARAIAAAAAR